jgi:hypothetical protein
MRNTIIMKMELCHIEPYKLAWQPVSHVTHVWHAPLSIHVCFCLLLVRKMAV